MDFEKTVQDVCERALKIFGVRGLRFRPMRRVAKINPKKGYVIGRTSLKTGLITIDIFTPLKREEKKISSILRTLSHEAAHHQKRPFRQIYKRHLINRQHFPEFYKQVEKNITLLKEDKILGQFFT